MDEKVLEARRAYKRKWNRENRDKLRMYQERYWKKRAEQAAKSDNEAVSGKALSED